MRGRHRENSRRARFGVALCTLGLPIAAAAGGGPLGIDHPVDVGDATGIFSRRVQVGLEYAAPIVVVAAALWEGDDTRFGHTAWQATDSLVLGTITSTVMKRAFGRARPSQDDSPNRWFQGAGHNSFPSGEVMEITTAVTPFILEYGSEYPAVWGLATLPVYDAIARVRARAHWQTDVLASLAIGSAIGYYSHSRQGSISVGLLPHGVTVGWKKSF
jgi:membrane-associated phospholipid phosphatase